MKYTWRKKNIALCGVLAAAALILSYIEVLIPLSFSVPGMKIGLANIAVVVALYKLGMPQALYISGIRVALVALLFGNIMTLAYSVCGALFSLLLMAGLKRFEKFGYVGISVAGGIAHNIGQVLCAAVILETKQIMYYLPVLVISGTVAGVAIGVISGLLLSRIKRVSFNS
jgi:Predicted membrane protein